MKNNPFKNFFAYRLSQDLVSRIFVELAKGIAFNWRTQETNEKLFEGGLHQRRSADPFASQWSQMGWVPPFEGNGGLLMEDIGQGVVLMCIQFNERILPGKVRDEKLRERIAKVEEMEGRSLYKFEYAQLRDEVEAALLPQAFIRRSRVFVMITREGFMFVFTPSAKRADAITYMLRNSIPAFDVPNSFWIYRTEQSVARLLREVAVGEVEDEESGRVLKATDIAVLQGTQKRTIRLKGVEVYSEDVSELLGNGYEPSDLGVKLIDGKGEIASVTLNTKGCYKALDLPGTSGEEGDEDVLRSYSFLVADACTELLDTLAGLLGGESKPLPLPEEGGEPAGEAEGETLDEEDDEL